MAERGIGCCLRRNPGAMERTPADPSGRTILLGLRLGEGSQSNRPGDWSPFEESIRRRIGEGLLEFDGSSLGLDESGRVPSNEVFADFVSVPV